jgi:hypothetical protein
VTQALIENGLYRALLPEEFWRHRGSAGSFHADAGGGRQAERLDRVVPWPVQRLRHDRGYLDPDAANEIFNVAPGILAWGAINHEVQAVPGGYKASARWDFASGSRQASWLGAHVRVSRPMARRGASRMARRRSAPSCFR